MAVDRIKLRSSYLFTFILFLAAVFRVHALTQDLRFHPDEAFFSTFARDAAVHGRWMLRGNLDKSPLSIYASALSMHFIVAKTNDLNIIEVEVKQGEFAARLPNVFASLILVALTMRLALDLSKTRYITILAGLLAATSSFLIVFSATAFTDGFMLMFMVAGLLAAVHHRPGWSGAFLALSFASKQQGVFYLPLILGVFWAQGRLNRATLQRLALASLTGVLILLLWDTSRPETSIFLLASENNNPERLFVGVDEILPRLETWLSYLRWALGSAWVTGVLVAIVVLGCVRFYLYHQFGNVQMVGAVREPPNVSWNHSTSNKTILAIALYTIFYLIAHWILAFNTYDRYLLPIMPLVILLTAWGVAQIDSRLLWSGVSILLIVNTLTGFAAARADIDIGSDGYPRDNDIIALADYLNSKPLGTIIYDHWSGWELGYYMGAWSDKRRVYYPEPGILVEDALLNPDAAPRYFVAPLKQGITAWLDAFERRGFEVQADFQTGFYTVHEIIPP